MKKHVALTLLALTTLGVLNAHIDLPEIDGRRFVLAQGRLHDPLGWLDDRWTTLSTRCGQVQSIEETDPAHAQALAAVRAYSPPDSGSAQLLQLLAVDDWLLAEVRFQTLNPAVVLLRRLAGEVQVEKNAIWSGSTAPWHPPALIRRHLEKQAPQAPGALLACLRPQNELFHGGSAASVVFLGVVDGVLGNLHRQVLLRDDGLARQA